MTNKWKRGIRKTGVAVVICIALLLALISCTTESCIEATLSRVNINFYQLVNEKEEDTTLQNLSVNTLPAQDSILYDSLNLKTVSLPLSQLAESSGFVFTFSMPDTSYIEDTIVLIDRIDSTLLADMQWQVDTFWRDSIFPVEVVEFYPLNDTLIFHYKSELGMITDECGFTHTYTLTEIEHTNNTIINIIISDAEITNRDAENIKIFF